MAEVGARISDVGSGVTFIQWKYDWSQGNNESNEQHNDENTDGEGFFINE